MRTSIYLPDDLAVASKEHGISISEVTQRALREEVRILQKATETTDKIVVDTDEGRRGFIGRWLIDPADGHRSTSPGVNPDTTYGVAITAKSRFAVYIAHSDGQWGPYLRVYDSLDDAQADHMPSDIVALATRELAPDRVFWLDI
jgi:hypothetical protein